MAERYSQDVLGSATVALAEARGLWVLALLAPLVLLYVLRARRTRRVVSSVWLFREARRELSAARRLRRLLPAVPLFIEAATVSVLALAAAGLSSPTTVTSSNDVAVIVDTSRSMGARDGTSTRMDRARDAAKALIGNLGGRGVLVIGAGRDARAASGVERDPRRLGAILDGLTLRDETSDLTAAVLAAEERLSRLPGAHRVVIVTDVNGDVPPKSRLPLDVIRVGAPVDNVAIARFELTRARGSEGDRGRVDALVVVQSFARQAAERFVSLTRRGTAAPVASRRVVLAPGERATLALAFDATEAETGTGIVAELSPADALPSDDRAFALVPPGSRLPVVVVKDGADPWLLRALSADETLDVEETTLPMAPGAVPRGGLLVAAFACPPVPEGGDVLFVAPPGGDCLGTRIAETTVATPAVTSWSDRDPRTRFVSFDDVHVLEARSIEAPRSAALLRAGDATLIADLGLVGRTGTVIGFDLQKSDWPLRASFVLFVRNVTELARANRARAYGSAARTGEPLRIAAPVEAGRAVSVHGPRGETPARLVQGIVVAEAPALAGFYDAMTDHRTVASAAVNADAADESDLLRLPRAAEARGAGDGAAAVTVTRGSLSPLFALAAAFGVVAEGVWLFRGRTRGRSSRRPPASAVVLGVLLVTAAAIATYALWVERHLALTTTVSFERPVACLGAVLLLGAALFIAARRPARGTRSALVDGFLGLAALGTALALAAPAIRSGTDELWVVLAVDRSRSTELVPDAPELIEHAVGAAEHGMRLDDRLGVVAFAAEPSLEEAPRRAAEPRSPQRPVLGRDGTDIAAAVRRALGEVPPDRAARIVLVSDGNATAGDTPAAAAAAALAGVPVDVLALEQRLLPNVRVDSVHAPSRANLGEAIDLRAAVRSTKDADVDVDLLIDGERQETGRQRIHAGEDVLFLRARADAPGLHRYDVRVRPLVATDDTIREDDSQATFVRVGGHARALVIEADPERAAPIRAALAAAEFDVDVVTATHAPAVAEELLANDLVVLGNVPARDLSPEQLEDLAAYVEHLGGGLLLVGGRSAMGPGGYAGTPIERVSPVSFELRNERRRARLAEVIAIDYSGSMSMAVGRHTKLDLANEAAVRSAELLTATDRLAVLHVDTAVSVTFPLGPVADKVELGRRVRAVGPGGGGIFVDRALEAAYGALDGEAVDQKHVLLFADGDDAEERQNAPAMARAARGRSITTSVVSLGRGRDAAGLEQLSREGGGRFYLIEDAARLPAVFAEETTIAAGSAIREEPFRARPSAPIAALRGVDLQGAPALGGYDVTRGRPRAEIALVATDDDPLLAVWSAGTGHAAAFTSDYSEPWGSGWRTWSGAARLFGQLARSLSRGADDPKVSIESSAAGGVLRIAANAVDAEGRLDVARVLSATVVGPGGFARTARLEPKGPGAYEARVPLGHPGTYAAEVVDEAAHTTVGTSLAVLSSGDELEPTGTDHALLDRIAAVSGGRVRKTLDGVFTDRTSTRRAFHPLTTLLCVVAAVAMLLSAAARRLPDSSLVERLAARTRARRPASAKRPPAPSTPSTQATTTADESVSAAPMPDLPAPETPATEVEAPEPTKTTAEILLSRRQRRR